MNKISETHFNSSFRGKLKRNKNGKTNHPEHYQSSFLCETACFCFILSVFISAHQHQKNVAHNENKVNGHLNGVLSTVIKTAFSSEITYRI